MRGLVLRASFALWPTGASRCAGARASVCRSIYASRSGPPGSRRSSSRRSPACARRRAREGARRLRDGAGDGIVGRQERHRDRALSRAPRRGLARRALQGAEHVAERRGHARRGGDRAGAGGAGRGGGRDPACRDEPDPAQAGGRRAEPARRARPRFASGVRALRRRSGLPVLGVLPYREDLPVPPEDSLSLDAPAHGGPLDVAVVRYPRISNFDDLSALAAAGAGVRYVREPAALGAPDLVVLPGSKSTLADLEWLRATGLGPRVV